MSEIDLGTTSEGMNCCCPPAAETKEAKKSYPKLCIRDDVIDKIEDSTGTCEKGDEIRAEVSLRVVGWRDDEYGKSIDFDVVSMKPIEKSTTEEGGKPSKKIKAGKVETETEMED